jgi:rhodanese-related sulfurtransferase
MEKELIQRRVPYRKSLRKTWASLVLVVLASFGVVGCSQEQRSPDMYAAIIDVRTQEEWSSGHLAGAIRIGIADSDFREQLEKLDKSADYYIYCRSGNRAGQAIDMMREIGFTGQLINGGSVANASSELSLEVVVDQ